VVKIAAFEMYDFVNLATPDYNATLTNPSQRVITEKGLKNQVIHLGDDGSEERISFSNQSIFHVGVQWPNKSESDIGQIIDFFYDTDKANGIVRSFKWTHPTDSHVYVVRFASNMTRTIRQKLFYGIPNAEFKVIGRIAD